MSFLDSLEGDYKSALKNYKLFHIYHDSLMDLENRIQFEKQIVQHEFDKQQLATKRKSDFLKLTIVFIFFMSL